MFFVFFIGIALILACQIWRNEISRCTKQNKIGMWLETETNFAQWIIKRFPKTWATQYPRYGMVLWIQSGVWNAAQLCCLLCFETKIVVEVICDCAVSCFGFQLY